MAMPAPSQDIENQLRALSRAHVRIDPKDILELVQSVMASIEGDHSSLNHNLHADIEALANYINSVKTEIAEINADKIHTEYLPEASDQLSAIVGATEQATNDIFEAVELIEELASKMSPEIAEPMNAAVTRVYEACGFQDLTGQRITKVVTALQNVESKVHELLQAFGEESGAGARATTAEPADDGEAAAPSDEDLIHGPQLPGNAIGQDEIDALLASFD